jgi:glycerol-3-phosphate dehydrogenase
LKGIGRTDYDVLVLGGGITGASVARDCALRGLRVALVERDDFASGTTGACMGMLHGGLQYLQSHPELTKTECLESGIMQKAAPHLVFSIPFLYLVPKAEQVDMFDAFFGYYDQFQKSKFGRPHVVLTPSEALELEPTLRPGFAAALTNEEPGVDVFRLNVLVALDAAERGALVRNHAEVTGLILEEAAPDAVASAAPDAVASRPGAAAGIPSAPDAGPVLRPVTRRVVGARIRDRLSGRTSEIRAKITVNACGPWVPQVTAMAGLSYRLRPTKGIHLILDRRITSAGVVFPAIDGRSMLVVPHENTTLIGCTDDDYFGDPDAVRPDPQEIEYVLTSCENVLPGIRRARIIRVMAGLRPTLYQYGVNEDKVTRDFEIWDHEDRDGLAGFITIAGGKMTIARIMAEKTTDAVVARLGLGGAETACRTAALPLPGGERQLGPKDIEALAQRFGVPTAAVDRLVYRHGTRAKTVLEEGRRDPGGRNLVCACEPVLEAEVRYAIRHEWARTIGDLRRRVRLGMGPCQGLGCSEGAAAVLGLELDLDPDLVSADLADFRQERWKGQRDALDGDQLRQQELSQAAFGHRAPASWTGRRGEGVDR